jgi:hypothetical protein
MKMEEQIAHTMLMNKHYSPMVVRKTSTWGFPVFVALITDDDLADLDQVILKFMLDAKAVNGWSDNIQKMRNLAGAMVEMLNNRYPKVEGSAVIIYSDKCFISSLHGDLMTHLSCKVELFELLNMSTGV